MKLRLVKFLTSREDEIEKKEEGGRSTTIMRSASTRPRPRPQPRSVLALLLPSSFHSLFLHHSPPARVSLRRSSLSAATCRQAVAPAIPPPAVPLLPFFFIKLPKQQSGRPLRSVVPSLPVQLADCGAQLAAPLPLHQIRWPRLLSGSNGILSVAGGAIGKQRPKMRFPVSFPSLLNK